VILALTIDARTMSTDHRATPVHSASGARIKTHSKRYRAWLRYVQLALLAARQRLRSWPLEWPDGYAVRVAVFVPDAHKRDLDNVVKPVLDAAKGVLWADDSAVRATEVVLGGVDREHPRIALLVLSGAHASDRASEIDQLAVMHAHQARAR
jgi:Holliday junction resolvase RusA-like endonuclease